MTPTLEEAQATLTSAMATAGGARARLANVETQIASGAGISGADYQAALGDVAVADGAIAGAHDAVRAAQIAATVEASEKLATEVVAWHESAVIQLDTLRSEAQSALLAFAEAARAHNDRITTYAGQSRSKGQVVGVIETHHLKPSEPVYLGRRVSKVMAPELIAGMAARAIEESALDFPRQTFNELKGLAAQAQPITEK
jgi:hypothetical protein